MSTGWERFKGKVNYRNLQPGERTDSVYFLNYISQFGTTKGITYSVVGSRGASCITRLKSLGYIKSLGGGLYEVTKKGWEYLESENLPKYERYYTEGEIKELRGQLRGLEREYNTALLRGLQDIGVDMKDMNPSEVSKMQFLLMGVGVPGAERYYNLEEPLRERIHEAKARLAHSKYIMIERR